MKLAALQKSHMILMFNFCNQTLLYPCLNKTSRSLRYFGHRLSLSLKTYPLTESFPILVEMAVFEWALREAFDAADENPLDMSDLVAIPLEQWDSVVFTLHPSIQRLNLLWNTPQLWKVIDEESEQIGIEKNAVRDYRQCSHWPIGKNAHPQSRYVKPEKFLTRLQLNAADRHSRRLSDRYQFVPG